MPVFAFEVEYAKSNRAACKKCKGKIDKDLVRVGFKVVVPEDAEGPSAHMGCSWHHVGCFPQAKGAAWFKKHLTHEVAENVPGLDSLKSEDRDTVTELFKACRGEIPMPELPQQPEASNSTLESAKKTSKKRKSADDDATAAKDSKGETSRGLTQKDEVAIAEAREKIASKNNAWLGAALVKNGLPKTGRKDELLNRVAEHQILGVPPICSQCNKKVLLWSRATGKFSCPGFFDDESKMFKRCKGPAADVDLQRSPWQELGA
jgi:hypothetical protein